MDFGLSEEQRLLERSLRRFLDEELPPSRVRAAAESERGFDAAAWKGLAALGALGCLVPEEHGGSGLGLLDASVVAWSLGHAAAPLPFLGGGVLAPLALRGIGTQAQQGEWLPKLASGEVVCTLAPAELYTRPEGAGVAMRGEVLEGVATSVPDALAAEAFLVPVGDDLWLLPADADGLELVDLPTVDRTRRVGELRLDGVRPEEAIGGRGAGGAALERVLDAGRIALAADVLGSCDRAVARAVAYAGQREQFGRPIGSFQAVKHMCAEMVAAVEPSRSLLWYAAHAWDALPEEAPAAAALCKAHLAEIGMDVLRTATEVHGGIGFTADGELHLWFKRVWLDRHLLGGPELLRERAARLQGLA